MGKINMGILYGKKYNPRNRTFSLENGENFIEGTGLLQGTLCDTGIPHTFYGGNICSVIQVRNVFIQLYPKALTKKRRDSQPFVGADKMEAFF